MSSVRLARTSILLVTALVAACGDGGPSSPPEPGIRVIGPVQAAGIMSVRTTGLSLSLDRYDATLGGTALAFARMNDSTLVSIVPEMPAGSYTLDGTIAGRTFSEAVSVSSAIVIADPGAAVDRHLEDVVAAYPAAAPEGFDDAEWQAMRDTALAAVDAARTAFASMTPDEQLAAARYMAAIEDALAPILHDQAALMAAAALTDACTGAAGTAFGYTLAYMGGVAALVGGVMVPGYQLLVPMGALMIWKAKPKAEKAITNMMSLCSKQEEVDLNFFEAGPGASSFQLASAPSSPHSDGGEGFGGVVPVQASVVASAQGNARVPFVRASPVRASPVQGIQKFSGSHIEENAQFSSISSMLDEVYRLIEGLPDFARRRMPNPFRISTVGEQPIELTSLGPDSVLISNVTGGVSLSRGRDGAVLLLTANAPGEDERQFSFNVVSTIDPEVSTTINAILVKEGVTLIPRAEAWSATVTTNQAAGTWRMTCRMEWTVAISGVHPVHLSSMTWNNETYSEAFADAPGSEQYPPNSYEPGTVVLWGEWWREFRSGEDSSDFFVTLSMGYRNTVTTATGTSNEIRMDCKLPTG